MSCKLFAFLDSDCVVEEDVLFVDVDARDSAGDVVDTALWVRWDSADASRIGDIWSEAGASIAADGDDVSWTDGDADTVDEMGLCSSESSTMLWSGSWAFLYL